MITYNNRTILDDGNVIYNEQGIIDLLLGGWSFDTPVLTDDDTLISGTNELFELYSIDKSMINGVDDTEKWYYPPEYDEINLLDYFAEKLIQRFNDVDIKYINRVNEELVLFETHNFTKLLRFMIYLVDVMNENNIVYGIGRGSSVASLLLFLIGLHMVDPIKYNIDIQEFLHF